MDPKDNNESAVRRPEQDESAERRQDPAPRQHADAYDDLDPFEIEFLPEFRQGRGPQEPFVNQYGVVIGDHMYESPESPHNNWTNDTDPNVMAGEEWVHPFKDIGFQTAENRDYFERGIPPKANVFMHPDKDVAYGTYDEKKEGEPERPNNQK